MDGFPAHGRRNCRPRGVIARKQGRVSDRIEDYAFLSDTQTGALVSRTGSIDWFCLPRFDSGACFAALLGDRSHGRWVFSPKNGISRTTRKYRGDTLILETEIE